MQLMQLGHFVTQTCGVVTYHTFCASKFDIGNMSIIVSTPLSANYRPLVQLMLTSGAKLGHKTMSYATVPIAYLRSVVCCKNQQIMVMSGAK
mmetsp:Transcript_8916/g.16770  ORF Transcript_8916/g.16770 Transcript_8916/m.16770 type:complete len:92 (-) Transcript_8916:340-615(-)